MKRILLIALLAFAPMVFAQDEEAAIKKSIQTFFEGMYARDTVMIKSVCVDGMALHSVNVRAKSTKFTTEDVSEFYKGIAAVPKTEVFEEKLLGFKIQYDDGIAQVWTSYEFYFGNKLSHTGNNAFTLVKHNGVWKISYIVDTRRAPQPPKGE
ncbi:nuclear transport factor 2 family protein [Flavobacterium akiainvivens]|uniref:nuclear transport factor 2 family protein n=1 Tax=Flavobacterium akiainvivens TaxID=1202724 RepID=UPI0008EA995F|nr:nuclear transport factor 2 family protein [Flavobacterium akiainvivens]SFQ41036.1 Putative lumazine-binding [Flavobacterium akiainvivens]